MKRPEFNKENYLRRRDIILFADHARRQNKPGSIRVFASEFEDEEFAWYDFDYVFEEEPNRAGNFTYRDRFSPGGPIAFLHLKMIGLMTEVFEENATGWFVNFTLRQQQRLKVAPVGRENVPIRLHKELRQAGLMHFYYLIDYENVSRLGFVKEGDAIIAQAIVDDFEFEF